eukprot:TRINITY_DN70263_c0_g1_i1.p1 TRINITY_DN70263_c0_g1~~TRINITY_DN70263_c0_g1_i1.p1  ORF type:complete len:613 (+),score=60.54 TRINITY_DN70263_c0_g1_i1:269-2107(+)
MLVNVSGAGSDVRWLSSRQHSLARVQRYRTAHWLIVAACCCVNGEPVARTSPWMTAIATEFSKGCEGASDGMCMPDTTTVVAAFASAAVDFESVEFLQYMEQVINTMLDWPCAMAGVIKILDPKFPWTRSYCDKVIGGSSWSFHHVSKGNWVAPRHTMSMARKLFPKFVASFNRWFAEIRAGNDLEATRRVDAVEHEKDPKVSTTRNWHLLFWHVRAKILRHITSNICRENDKVHAKLRERDVYQRTVFHLVASVGNTAAIKAFAASFPKQERISFLQLADRDGFTALDYAHSGHFDDTAACLRKLGSLRTIRALDPITLFQRRSSRELDGSSRDDDGACPTSAASCPSILAASVSGAAVEFGGWNATLAEVPEAWMPRDDKRCFADVIDISQFNWDVFWRHYVWHSRPLMIRGGARMPTGIRQYYTRDGLIRTAGHRTVETMDYPYADVYALEKPLVSSLKEYIDYLDDRRSGHMVKKLKYLFLQLEDTSDLLNFSYILPEIVAGREFFKAHPPQFYLGGAFMGSSLHHHHHALNSLLHGTKLWYIKPPSGQVWINDVVYDYLVRTNGMPDASKCVQEAGDLLFVPKGWSHGTMCLNDCIGAASEFLTTDR